MNNLPLKGIRVVDLTVVWVGPLAAQILADWGAEVIRVEPLRVFQPFTRGMVARPPVIRGSGLGGGYPDSDPGDRPWNRDAGFQIHGRNKLSMTGNLPSPDFMEMFLRLVSISDVVLENNLAETTVKLGLTYENLRRARPDIIVVKVPGFGASGPYANHRAFGSMMEAVAGYTSIRGYSSLPVPTKGMVFVADGVGGFGGAYATLTTLYQRKRTGRGGVVDVATTEGIYHYMGEAVMDHTMNGRSHTALDNHDTSMAPHGCYPCRGEDQWAVVAIETDEEWARLRRVMGDPEWARDPVFDTILGRYRHQDKLDEGLRQWTRGYDHIELMHLLQKEGLAAAAVLDQRELLEDPHMEHRRAFRELYQPATGTHKYAGMLWHTSRGPNEIRLPSPMLGEHNEWAYKELLGVSEEEYRGLEKAGHIGMDYPPEVP